MKHSFIELPKQSAFAFNKTASFYRQTGKRWLDVVGTLFLTPIILPLVAILWLLVKRDGGTGFFGHRRIGADGRAFYCWKLRSMVPNAEQVLLHHLAKNPNAALEWAENCKLIDDPRITHFGRLLRKTSLDELPQFWNVLIGDMGLVGPRPIPRSELEKYRGFEWAYFTFRPGITGIWQVSGRNTISYAKRVELDARYLRRAGVWFDLKIIAKTVGVVLRKTGC